MMSQEVERQNRSARELAGKLPDEVRVLSTIRE